MWISKRKWNKIEENIFLMNKTIENIVFRQEVIKDELTELEKAHKDDIYTYIDVNRCTCTKRKYSHRKEEIKASTSNIKDVTLEELARLVIDHEPIVREENVKFKVEYR